MQVCNLPLLTTPRDSQVLSRVENEFQTLADPITTKIPSTSLLTQKN